MFVFIFNILDIVSKTLLPYFVWFKSVETLVNLNISQIVLFPRESVRTQFH